MRQEIDNGERTTPEHTDGSKIEANNVEMMDLYGKKESVEVSDSRRSLTGEVRVVANSEPRLESFK